MPPKAVVPAAETAQDRMRQLSASIRSRSGGNRSRINMTTALRFGDGVNPPSAEVRRTVGTSATTRNAQERRVADVTPTPLAPSTADSALASKVERPQGEVAGVPVDEGWSRVSNAPPSAALGSPLALRPTTAANARAGGAALSPNRLPGNSAAVAHAVRPDGDVGSPRGVNAEPAGSWFDAPWWLRIVVDEAFRRRVATLAARALRAEEERFRPDDEAQNISLPPMFKWNPLAVEQRVVQPSVGASYSPLEGFTHRWHANFPPQGYVQVTPCLATLRPVPEKRGPLMINVWIPMRPLKKPTIFPDTPAASGDPLSSGGGSGGAGNHPLHGLGGRGHHHRGSRHVFDELDYHADDDDDNHGLQFTSSVGYHDGAVAESLTIGQRVLLHEEKVQRQLAAEAEAKRLQREKELGVVFTRGRMGVDADGNLTLDGVRLQQKFFGTIRPSLFLLRWKLVGNALYEYAVSTGAVPDVTAIGAVLCDPLGGPTPADASSTGPFSVGAASLAVGSSSSPRRRASPTRSANARLGSPPMNASPARQPGNNGGASPPLPLPAYLDGVVLSPLPLYRIETRGANVTVDDDDRRLVEAFPPNSASFFGLRRFDPLSESRRAFLFQSAACRRAVNRVFSQLPSDATSRLHKEAYVEFVLDLLHVFFPTFHARNNIEVAEDEWLCRGTPENPDFLMFYQNFFDVPLMLCRGKQFVTEELYVSVWDLLFECLYGRETLCRLYEDEIRQSTTAPTQIASAAALPSPLHSPVSGGPEGASGSQQPPWLDLLPSYLDPRHIDSLRVVPRRKNTDAFELYQLSQQVMLEPEMQLVEPSRRAFLSHRMASARLAARNQKRVVLELQREAASPSRVASASTRRDTEARSSPDGAAEDKENGIDEDAIAFPSLPLQVKRQKEAQQQGVPVHRLSEKQREEARRINAMLSLENKASSLTLFEEVYETPNLERDEVDDILDFYSDASDSEFVPASSPTATGDAQQGLPLGGRGEPSIREKYLEARRQRELQLAHEAELAAIAAERRKSRAKSIASVERPRRMSHLAKMRPSIALELLGKAGTVDASEVVMSHAQVIQAAARNAKDRARDDDDSDYHRREESDGASGKRNSSEHAGPLGLILEQDDGDAPLLASGGHHHHQHHHHRQAAKGNKKTHASTTTLDPMHVERILRNERDRVRQLALQSMRGHSAVAPQRLPNSPANAQLVVEADVTQRSRAPDGVVPVKGDGFPAFQPGHLRRFFENASLAAVGAHEDETDGDGVATSPIQRQSSQHPGSASTTTSTRFVPRPATATAAHAAIALRPAMRMTSAVRTVLLAEASAKRTGGGDATPRGVKPPAAAVDAAPRVSGSDSVHAATGRMATDAVDAPHHGTVDPEVENAVLQGRSIRPWSGSAAESRNSRDGSSWSSAAAAGAAATGASPSDFDALQFPLTEERLELRRAELLASLLQRQQTWAASAEESTFDGAASGRLDRGGDGGREGEADATNNNGGSVRLGGVSTRPLRLPSFLSHGNQERVRETLGDLRTSSLHDPERRRTSALSSTMLAEPTQSARTRSVAAHDEAPLPSVSVAPALIVSPLPPPLPSTAATEPTTGAAVSTTTTSATIIEGTLTDLPSRRGTTTTTAAAAAASGAGDTMKPNATNSGSLARSQPTEASVVVVVSPVAPGVTDSAAEASKRFLLKSSSFSVQPIRPQRYQVPQLRARKPPSEIWVNGRVIPKQPPSLVLVQALQLGRPVNVATASVAATTHAKDKFDQNAQRRSIAVADGDAMATSTTTPRALGQGLPSPRVAIHTCINQDVIVVPTSSDFAAASRLDAVSQLTPRGVKLDPRSPVPNTAGMH